MHLPTSLRGLRVAAPDGVGLPTNQLPERVLQFGTGALLRALPDYVIDKANQQGVFNGRIVAVRMTGGASAFTRQQNQYTLCIRGVEAGKPVEENRICSAISRVLSAQTQWADVLAYATSPDVQVVMSNTSEMGFQLVQDDVRDSPPHSFPGKLLAVLYARYQAFNGSLDAGLVILPTELIANNGTRLEGIVLELAHRNALDGAFIDWLETANHFCNTLVDHIVPDHPDLATLNALTDGLGYDDELVTIAEPYHLWAIEAPAPVADHIRQVLAFHGADSGVLIQPNIDLFGELKLRLLNGAHTLSCGLAVLCGFTTVGESLANPYFGQYVRGLMYADLVPGLPIDVDEALALRYAGQVLDRFCNPYIDHRWHSITWQYSLKIQLRNVPTLLHFCQKNPGSLPAFAALGLAGYLLFMRGIRQENGQWFGRAAGQEYLIMDDKAPYFADLWARFTPIELVTKVLANKTLWEYDMTRWPLFTEAVGNYLMALLTTGPLTTVMALCAKKDRSLAPTGTAVFVS